MLRRAEAEANEIESMKRKVDLEGRRLLVVRAAEKAGFWYTVNFEGLGGVELCSFTTPPPPALILTAFSLFFPLVVLYNNRHYWKLRFSNRVRRSPHSARIFCCLKLEHAHKRRRKEFLVYSN